MRCSVCGCGWGSFLETMHEAKLSRLVTRARGRLLWLHNLTGPRCNLSAKPTPCEGSLELSFATAIMARDARRIQRKHKAKSPQALARSKKRGTTMPNKHVNLACAQSAAAVDSASTFEKGGRRSMCIQRQSAVGLDVSNPA
jgi:hypothetical protein